jgi:cytochrome P450
VDGFRDYQARVEQLDLSYFLGLPDWLPRIGAWKVKKSAQRIHAVVDDIIDEHQSANSADVETPPIIAKLLDARTRGDGTMTVSAIRNESIVIFMAGHETTANTLSWAIYNLSQCSRSRRAIETELKAVLDGRTATYDDVKSLKFSRSIIEETLRLYPPVPILARRAKQDGSLGGKPIKKNTLLFVSPWLTHRNPKIWSQPDAFIPERFLAKNSSEIDKYTYFPFATGPRVCPGMVFGMTESIIVLATLVQNFDIRLQPGEKAQVTCRLTLRPGDKLRMAAYDRSVDGSK